MTIMQRLGTAAREGRLWSVTRRRLLIPYAILRELYLRFFLKLRIVKPMTLPSLLYSGSFSRTAEGKTLKDCFEAACTEPSNLPAQIRDIEGMSGQRYRSFINRLVGSVADARYLEVGSWAGSTAAAALFGNRVTALCIDNWSMFGGPRLQFFENMKLVLSEKISFRIIEQDFRKVDFGSIGRFNVYLFDGPHEERDQYDGVVLAQPALPDRYYLIVDDWNWQAVRLGTFQALRDTGCRVDSAVEIRTSLDNEQPLDRGANSDWHNGYFLAVVFKTP